MDIVGEFHRARGLAAINPLYPYDLASVHPRDSDTMTVFDNVDIDIVAVHGMNMESYPQQSRDDWATQNGLWLREILPDYTDKKFRAMLFAYHGAGIEFDIQDSWLSEHSNRLLVVLKVRRELYPDRPLVFVCHDIGGLVVKDALVKAAQDPLFKDIADATKLLIFFNTPHANSTIAAQYLAEFSIHLPSDDVIDNLVYECEEIEKRLRAPGMPYCLWSNRLVVNFYATLPFLGLHLLVEKSDTLVGLPDVSEKHLPIYADHVDMCKLDYVVNDAACRMVMRTIGMEIDRVFTMSQRN